MWKQDKQEGNRSMSDHVDADDDGSPVPAAPISGEDISAFVGKGVAFKGTIIYSGTVRIDGSLDGEIHTEGVLLVGEEAVITAKVVAGTIVCQGKITGDISAKDKIKLQAPAVISGGVTTPLLSIEEGVLFNGTLEMTQGVQNLPRALPVHPALTPVEHVVARVK